MENDRNFECPNGNTGLVWARQYLKELIEKNDASPYKEIEKDRYSPLKLIVLFKLLLAAAKQFSSKIGEHLAWEDSQSFNAIGKHLTSLPCVFGSNIEREKNGDPFYLLKGIHRDVASYELHFAPPVIQELISGHASFDDAFEFLATYLILHYDEVDVDVPRSINHMAVQEMDALDHRYAQIVPFVFALDSREHPCSRDFDRSEIQMLLVLAMAIKAGKEYYKEAVLEEYLMNSPTIETAEIIAEVFGKSFLNGLLRCLINEPCDEETHQLLFETLQEDLLTDVPLIKHCTKMFFRTCDRAKAQYLFTRPSKEKAYLTVKEALAKLFSKSVSVYGSDYSIAYSIICLRDKNCNASIKSALKDVLSPDSRYSKLLGLSKIRAISLLEKWDLISDCPEIPVDSFSAIIQTYLNGDNAAEQVFALNALSEALEARVVSKTVLNCDNIKAIVPFLRSEQTREVAENILSHTPISCITHAAELKREENQELMIHYSSLLELEPSAKRHLKRFSILVALGWIDRKSVVHNLQLLCRTAILPEERHRTLLSVAAILREYINEFAVPLSLVSDCEDALCDVPCTLEQDDPTTIIHESQLAVLIARLDDLMKHQDVSTAKKLVKDCSLNCSLKPSHSYLITRFFYYLCAFGEVSSLTSFYKQYSGILDRPVRVDCTSILRLVGNIAEIMPWRSDIGYEICKSYNTPETLAALSQGKRAIHALEVNDLYAYIERDLRSNDEAKIRRWKAFFGSDFELQNFLQYMLPNADNDILCCQYWDEPLCQQFLKAQSFSFYALNKEDPYSTCVCIRKEFLK